MDEIELFTRARPATEPLSDTERMRLWARATGTVGVIDRVGEPGASDSEPLVDIEMEFGAVEPAEMSSLPERRTSLMLAAVAACVALLIVGVVAAASTRGTSPAPAEQPTPADIPHAEPDTGLPRWYSVLRPIVPDRFDYLALTMAAGDNATFVAIDTITGKSLEVSVTPPTMPEVEHAVISTSQSSTTVETAQGWRVTETDGATASISCNIGARGRDFPGPPNYCDLMSTAPFGKAEIRAVAEALTPGALFDAARQSADAIRPVPGDGIADMIAAALPDQHMIGDTYWAHGDRIWDYSTIDDYPETSVRIVTGIVPRPLERLPLKGSTGRYGLYDDSAAFWIIDPSGVAVRVSTTNVDPLQPNTGGESLEALDELARSILDSLQAP